MLSESERREVEAELLLYPNKRAACVEAMKVIQRHRGWVGDDSLQELGRLLEMTPAELDSVATFYNLIFRRPVGEHVILLCDSISCWIMGAERLQEHIQKRLDIPLGGTSSDGRFTLLPIPCLGTCDHAPAMMIDDELYRDLDPPQVEHVLGLYTNRSHGHGTSAHS